MQRWGSWLWERWIWIKETARDIGWSLSISVSTTKRVKKDRSYLKCITRNLSLLLSAKRSRERKTKSATLTVRSTRMTLPIAKSNLFLESTTTLEPETLTLEDCQSQPSCQLMATKVPTCKTSALSRRESTSWCLRWRSRRWGISRIAQALLLLEQWWWKKIQFFPDLWTLAQSLKVFERNFGKKEPRQKVK